MANNPFAPPQRSQLADTAHRFPDVLNQDPDLRLPYPQQQQQQQQYAPQYQQPQQTGYLQPQGTGFGAGGGGYSGQGGGQLYSPGAGAYVGGLSPGGAYQQQYGQGQYGQPGGGGYGGGFGGQPSPSPSVSFSTADLDPYSSLSQLNPSSTPSGQQQGQGGQGGGGGGTLLAVQQTQSHPRQFVHENKAQLMTWDEYSWKQLLSRVDALREAWETRLAGIKAAANQGADPTLVDALRRDAENYVDSIHAAKMQLSEVKSGWRHSTDAASKARVREALNAGLSSLPEYPQPLSPSSLGGAFHDASRKSGIMAQFGASQQPQYPQQTGYMQPQQTGFSQQQQQQYLQQAGYMQPQQTGFGGYGGGGMGMGVQQQMQPQMTGYMPQQQQQTGYNPYGQQQGGGGYY
ncbi:hypothetical protein JCM8547_008497 [Rhodosporidiobolus lusitaniae]